MSRTAPRVFISPCGTSLLTNATDKERRQLLIQTANCQEEELTPEQKREIDVHLQERRQQLIEADLETVKQLSAELHGIIAYHNGNLSAGKTGTPDQHFLLVTDTYQGKQVGDMVAQWLNLHQLQAQKVEEIPDLATGDREAFRWAMTELISWCDGTLSGYRKDGWHVVFNLTGGFKSVNGFLQAVGMFYAHESVYIFQSSSQLLRIPPRCLDDHGSNSEYNLKSLDFKPLKGKPFPDSTHECDAWSDQDAKRLYGHYESNGQFMIDRLGKHL